MGFFTYLKHDDNDFVQDATVLTPSSEDTTYPASTLKVLPISNTWRTTGVASESLQIALATAKRITVAGWVNHNLTSAAVAKIYGGSTPNPDGSEFQVTIPWREHDMYVELDETYRYWKQVVQDPTNTLGYLEFGYPVGGLLTTLEFNFVFGWTVSDEFTNIGGYEFGVPNLQEGFEQVRVEMSWEELTEAEATTLRTLFRSLKGNLNPFFLIPDPAKYEGYFGRFNGPLTITRHRRYSGPTQFESDSRGLALPA